MTFSHTFQDAPAEIMNAVFTEVPHFTRIMVLPVVCKHWQKCIQQTYGKFFDLHLLAKSILDQMNCPLALEKFICQHKKSNLYLSKIQETFTTITDLPKNYTVSWQDGNDANSYEYFTCLRMGGLDFSVRRDSKIGGLHCDNKKKWKDLRAKCSLSCIETSRVLGSREQYFKDDGGFCTTSNVVNSVSIYRDLEFKIGVSDNLEKATINGWKKVESSKAKHQKTLTEICCQLNLCFESCISRSTLYNQALLAETKIEEFEPSRIFYCNNYGRIIKQKFGHKIEILVTSINIGNGKLIKALSWEPSKNDRFFFGVDYAILHAVLGKTTHHLCKQFGLELHDEKSPAMGYTYKKKPIC